MAEDNQGNFQNSDTSRLAKTPKSSGAPKAPEVPLSQADTKSVRPIQDPMEKRSQGTVKLKPISASETGQIPIDTGADISDTVKLRVLKEKRRATGPATSKQTVRLKAPSASDGDAKMGEIKASSTGQSPVSEDTVRMRSAASANKTLKLTPAPGANSGSEDTVKMRSAASAGKTLKLTPAGAPTSEDTVRMKSAGSPNKTLKLSAAGSPQQKTVKLSAAGSGSKTLKLKQTDDMEEAGPSLTSPNMAPPLPELGAEMGGILTTLNTFSFIAAAATLTFVVWSYMNLDYFC